MILKKSLKIPDIRILIEEEQTTQWPKEKGQKDKQRSTKRTHKTIDWVTRTPLKVRESFPLKMISVNKIISFFFLLETCAKFLL